jgi:hypothetical protein
MQWLIDRDGPLADFMMNQTRRALSVLYPDFSFA